VLITFLVPGAKHPIGGAIAMYEFANGMSRRGHEVQVVHIDFIGNSREQVYRFPDRVETLDDIDGFTFEERIEHHFPRSFDETELPDADFVFFIDDRVPTRSGLPVILVQGYGLLTQEFEHQLYRAPCPKVCVAKWLVDVGKQLGVADDQLVHVPYGLRHQKYNVRTPVEDRPLQVSMLYNGHPTKAANLGLAALAEAKRRIPELRVMVFGSTDPIHSIPDGITYLTSPPQDAIVNDIYNQSRVFISSSILEGFGMGCVEAMACGCALVTTANGGSEDYAIHGETALVCDPEDVSSMADQVEWLLLDDETRIRLVLGGQDYVRRFDWDTSAEMLDQFLRRYQSDPNHYRQPAGQCGSESLGGVTT
jgi:glycosyltransferase involved in cell wall biosynthesis